MWRTVSWEDMACGDGSTGCGSGGAGGEDAGTKLFDLVETDPLDHTELGKRSRTREHDVAQGRGAEDEELRQAETFGFGGTPCA